VTATGTSVELLVVSVWHGVAVALAGAGLVVVWAVHGPTRRAPAFGAPLDDERPDPSPAARLLATAAARLGPAVHRVRRRHRAVMPDDAAAWCDELARRVRSGSTLHEALVAVEPGHPAVRRAVAPARLALDRGASVAAITESATSRGEPRARPTGAEHVELVLSVAGACARVGSPAAEPLDRTAAALRLRAADRAERAAQGAQARMSAHVLTIVPAVALALLLVGDPRVRTAVLDPVGLACVVMGGALNGVGWWWMRRIVGSPG
jgi:tight adherence protein B